MYLCFILGAYLKKINFSICFVCINVCCNEAAGTIYVDSGVTISTLRLSSVVLFFMADKLSSTKFL